MIILTSISPNHSNNLNQIAAVKSWQQFGNCYALNHKDDVLADIPGVKYIKSNKTVEALTGKRCMTINAMIDFAIKCNEDLLIINSDILLTELPLFNNDGITIISRYDYTDSINNSKIFTAGFDVVFIPRQFLTIFPPSIYAMGVAWWDYSLPYRAILSGIPVYWPDVKCAFHKLHNTQYSQAEWLYIGEYFRWEFKLNQYGYIGKMATEILSKIQTRAIR